MTTYTKTYSELRQATYFKAARELVRIAQAFLDDTFSDQGVEYGELVTPQTARWAIEGARQTAKQAQALFTLGHEQCIASQLSETLNNKAWYAYSKAITRFEDRVRKHLTRKAEQAYERDGSIIEIPASIVAWSGHETGAHPAGF